MSGGHFNLVGHATLHDMFSAKAEHIARSADKVAQKMTHLQNVAGRMSSGLKVAAGAFAGFFAFHKLKELYREGAEADTLATRFKHIFKAGEKQLKVSHSQMENTVKTLSKLSAIDDDTIKGKIAAPMMQTGMVAGKNLLRGMQVAVNLASLHGQGSAAAVEKYGSLISTALANPKRGIMQIRKLAGLSAEKATELQKLAKRQKNLVYIQDFLLTRLERVAKGGAEAGENTAARTLLRLTNGYHELKEAMGQTLDVFAGSKLKTVGTYMKDIGDELKETIERVRDGGAWSFNWDAITQGSTVAKYAIMGVTAVVATLITAMGFMAVGAALTFIGMTWPISLALAAIASLGVAVYAIYEHWDSIKAYFTSITDYISNTWRNLWLGLGDAMDPWLKTVQSKFDTFLAINRTMWSMFKGTFENITGIKMEKVGDAILNPVDAVMGKDFTRDVRHSILGNQGISYYDLFPSKNGMVSGAGGGYSSGYEGLKQWFNSMEAGKYRSNAESMALYKPSLLPEVMGLRAPMEAQKAIAEATVSGDVNITLSDPYGLLSMGVTSTGNIPLNRGIASAGRYRSTQPSISAAP